MSGVNLPEGWLITKFTEVLEVQGGTQPPKAQFINEPQEGYVRLLQIRDFGSRPVPTFIPDTPKLKKCDLSDILIGRYGASLGRICTGMEGAYNVALAKVLSGDYLHKSFLKAYLESEMFQQPLALLSRSAQNGFNKEDLATFDFALIPLAEQKVIADKLDTLLAQVGTTKARLERILKILKTFRQSVLAAAVSGKLTEEWRLRNPDCSIKEYLDNLKNERIKLKELKILKKSFGLKKFRAPISIQIPKGWEWVTFEHISEHDKNALKAGPFGSALKKSDCVERGYKVYGQEQVIAGDEKLATYFINDSKFQQLASCAVKPDDILISLVGTIGKVLILSNEAQAGIINPRLVKLSLQHEINRPFIKYYLNSPLAHDFFKGFSHGGTMDILNLGILKQLPIPLPPLKEQTEIVHRVKELFTFADTIEHKANAALERVNNLTQSILAKAFRGELTVDWRTANPDLISGENSAEALLEKIKAEREAIKPRKKAKRKT